MVGARQLYLSQFPLLTLAFSSVYDWPNVLGNTWLFDQGSTFGYLPVEKDGSFGLSGPAPDWALGSNLVPFLGFDAIWSSQPGRPRTPASNDSSTMAAGKVVMKATGYPGSVFLEGSVDEASVDLSAHVVFASSNVSLIRLKLKNRAAAETADLQFRLAGSASQATGQQGMVAFDLPSAADLPCFPSSNGRLVFANFSLESAGQSKPLSWFIHSNASLGSFEATSSQVSLAAGEDVTTFLAISVGEADDKMQADEATKSFEATIHRWNGYISTVLASVPAKSAIDMRWAAVKSVQTLMYNWRSVPGLPDGVLPSYIGYQGGMWSWDSYKQAVAMASFAPNLAQQQIQLIVAAQDSVGHIPDKVDRCGRGGGCSGKPPLLGWSVWEVYKITRDLNFLRQMYPAVQRFHEFWYSHRDVTGTGLCSWTEGMESGMDDGVRFMPDYAKSVTNTSTHVTTLDFWSIDLNAYLYKEKRVLADMASALGLSQAAENWSQAAKNLLPRLQATFFIPDSSDDPRGFFQDVYFNGTALPIQGCEGYAALFTELATLPQAVAVAKTLSDPNRFLLNFSLPTVSKENKNYNAKGYWKGPTWLDQTWFAYRGLKYYAAAARSQGWSDSDMLQSLAEELKRRVFLVGKGFGFNDTTPLNEHYDAETGEPEGATHFGWTAAHTLMWAMEADDSEVLFI